MRLSAPKQGTFWLALILAVIAVVFKWILPDNLQFLNDNWSFLILLIGFVIIGLGTFVKGF